MKVCPNCHLQYDDSVSFCTACGTPLPAAAQPEIQAPPYAPPYAQQGYQNAQPNQQYAYNPAYSQPFDVQLTEIKNSISTVKTLGIISIVFLFFAQIVTLVCAIIGIIKGNDAINKARLTGDPMLIKEAEDAKKLNKIALIIAIVITVIAIIATIALVALGVYTSTSGGSMPDFSEFG